MTIGRSRLLAVLHSEPAGSGALTLGRVELACNALNFASFTVANLYPAQLPNTNTFPKIQDDPVWANGRSQILDFLDAEATGAVLLGYGVSPPSGVQRRNYLDQVSWLSDELRRRTIAVWTFGNRTSHPSRWHRHVHKQAPGQSIEETARRFLIRYQP